MDLINSEFIYMISLFFLRTFAKYFKHKFYIRNATYLF
jgi:hypothetical protein